MKSSMEPSQKNILCSVSMRFFLVAGNFRKKKLEDQSKQAFFGAIFRLDCLFKLEFVYLRVSLATSLYKDRY
jgi:hypothetical protein